MNAMQQSRCRDLALSAWARVRAAPRRWRNRTGRRAPSGSLVQQADGARTRLRVRPLYPYRHYHSLYPLPYDIEYPGPNAQARMRRRATSPSIARAAP